MLSFEKRFLLKHCLHVVRQKPTATAALTKTKRFEKKLIDV